FQLVSPGLQVVERDLQNQDNSTTGGKLNCFVIVGADRLNQLTFAKHTVFEIKLRLEGLLIQVGVVDLQIGYQRSMPVEIPAHVRADSKIAEYKHIVGCCRNPRAANLVGQYQRTDRQFFF